VTVNLIQAEVSGKASNEGEKGEDGDEQKLESIGGKSEGVLLFFDVITRCLGLDPGSGGSGQEGRDGALLLALENGKTIVVNIVRTALGGNTGLGSLLVVEVRDGGSVYRGVDEDRLDGSSGGSSRDLASSELEVLGLIGERRVSLAGRRGLRGRSLLDGLGGRSLSDSTGCELRGVEGGGRSQEQSENSGELHC